MVLYKLPFAFYPISDVYARDENDIVDWLDKLSPQILQDPDLTPKNGKNKVGGVEDIIAVERAELYYDFGGMVAGNEFAEIPLADDFTLKIRMESVPSFHYFRQKLRERKKGNLYGVHSTNNGAIITSTFLPQDLYENLKTVDLTPYQEKAREHIMKLNKGLAQMRKHGGVIAYPRPTKKEDYN